jgi:ribosomal protein L21E
MFENAFTRRTVAHAIGCAVGASALLVSGCGGDQAAVEKAQPTKLLALVGGVEVAAPLPVWTGTPTTAPLFAQNPLAAAATTTLSVTEVLTSTTSTIFRGTHTIAAANVANYRIAAFAHYDVFYLQADATTTINADGTFQVSIPRVVSNADRVVLDLHASTFDPLSPSNCVAADGYCRGVINGSTKISIPLDPSVLTAMSTYYFPGTTSTNYAPIAALQRLMNTPTISGGPYGDGRLIRSYRDMDSAFLYDQALAVIALVHERDQANADLILNALAKLQQTDGAFEFSYMVDGERADPSTDLRIAGSNAWVAMALNAYQDEFDSTKYLTMSTKLHTYLLGQLVSMTVNGATRSGLRFAPTDYAPGRTHVFALEHQLDGYAALHQYYAMNGGSTFNDGANKLRAMSEAMWNGSYFYSGYNDSSNAFSTDERYLDNYSWSVLALGNTGSSGQNFAGSLTQMCDFFIEDGQLNYPSGKYTGVVGFYDSIYSNTPPASKFVWSEGSLGAIMAIKQGAPSMKCKGNSATNMFESLQAMRDPLKGMPYATASTNPDFSNSSSVAGTAWYYFALAGVNPYAFVPY